MNRTGCVIILVIVLGVAGVAFVVWKINRSLNRATGPSGTSEVAPPSQVLEPPTAKIAVAKRQRPGGPYEPRDPRWQWWNEQKKIDPKFEWKMPIEFYGIVVDETEASIPAANVKLQWNDSSQTGTSYAEMMSGGDGRFSLRNVTGKVLEVRVSKEGYETLDYVKAFEYAAFFDEHFYTPDRDAPIVFKLRKRKGAEPLIVRQTLYGFRIDGTPHSVDLRTGTKRVGADDVGDLIIRVNRPEKPEGHFDWSFSIGGVGEAGLIEVEEGSMAEAPEEGYEASVEYRFDSSDPNWRSSSKKRFFVRTSDGKFARFEADVMARYNDQAAIDLQSYLNPSGSRNLEYDPAKQASAPTVLEYGVS
jgi:hypothetical protein